MDSKLKIKLNIKLKKILNGNIMYFLPLQFYIGGSSCLEFIDNPNNTNIIIVYQKDPLNAMNKQVEESINSIANEEKIDTVFVDQDEPSVYDYLYSSHYVNIFGSDEYKLNLFNERDKVFELIKRHYNKYVGNNKHMFEVIYYYYLISNNSFELFPFQKRILKNWHDGIYSEELLEDIVNELNLKGE